MMDEDRALEELRVKTHDDLARICKEYIQIYDKLYPFFRNSENYLPRLKDDKQIMSNLIQTYDKIKKDLIDLDGELGHYMESDPDEQTLILAQAGNTISKASMFVLDLPLFLQATEVGKNLSFK